MPKGGGSLMFFLLRWKSVKLNPAGLKGITFFCFSKCKLCQFSTVFTCPKFHDSLGDLQEQPSPHRNLLTQTDTYVSVKLTVRPSLFGRTPKGSRIVSHHFSGPYWYSFREYYLSTLGEFFDPVNSELDPNPVFSRWCSRLQKLQLDTIGCIISVSEIDSTILWNPKTPKPQIQMPKKNLWNMVKSFRFPPTWIPLRKKAMQFFEDFLPEIFPPFAICWKYQPLRKVGCHRCKRLDGLSVIFNDPIRCTWYDDFWSKNIEPDK